MATSERDVTMEAETGGFASKMEGGPQATECRRLWKLEKAKERDFPLKLPEGAEALILAHKTIWTSDRQTCMIMHMPYFKSLSLW